MCDLSQAYNPLLCKTSRNSVLTASNKGVFGHNWYSYEAEHESKHHPSDALHTVLPTSSTLTLTDNVKPIENLKKKRTQRRPMIDESIDSELFIGFLFADWSNRDILIMILVLQFFLLLTIALK